MRLAILVLYWVAQPTLDHVMATRLYSIARQILELASEVNAKVPNATFYFPHFSARHIMLATNIILRAAKSPLSTQLPTSEFEQMFAAGLNMVNAYACYQDLYHRNAIILQQLWTSDAVFVRDDEPQNGFRIDQRHRMVRACNLDG